MNQQQFDRLFTALYFALSAHSQSDGIAFRKGQSFYKDGYALIEFDQGYSLKLELADVLAFRDASTLKKQRLLEGLIGQARLALSGGETQSRVNSSESVEQD